MYQEPTNLGNLVAGGGTTVAQQAPSSPLEGAFSLQAGALDKLLALTTELEKRLVPVTTPVSEPGMANPDQAELPVSPTVRRVNETTDTINSVSGRLSRLLDALEV
jgi:anti-sigma factor ChrR (cupin superfamily)